MITRWIAFFLMVGLLGSPAYAKPDKDTGRSEASQGQGGKGGGRNASEARDRGEPGGGKGSGKAASESRGGSEASKGFTFSSQDRDLVRRYFSDSAGGASCPPGLAKKNNGCQPPGLARKWTRGQPLPRDVEWYELPGELVIRLPVPPIDHRYVRVAGDILLIATGTAMVVDAIEDLGRL